MEDKKLVKINYNIETGEIIGYYPNFLNYKNIPNPTILVNIEDYYKCLEKKMVVKEGALQEYNKPKEEIFKHKQESLIYSRIAYLQNTDYKIIKQSEGVENCPQDILDKRNLAREEINKIENCKTLKQLNKYSIEF